jgi:hypothetical protein
MLYFKTIIEDGKEIISSSSLVASDFSHGWSSENALHHIFRIEISTAISTDIEYIFSIDGVKFSDLPREPVKAEPNLTKSRSKNDVDKPKTPSKPEIKNSSETKVASRNNQGTGATWDAFPQGNVDPFASSQSFDPFGASSSSDPFASDPFASSVPKESSKPEKSTPPAIKPVSKPSPTAIPPPDFMSSNLTTTKPPQPPQSNNFDFMNDSFVSNNAGQGKKLTADEILRYELSGLAATPQQDNTPWSNTRQTTTTIVVEQHHEESRPADMLDEATKNLVSFDLDSKAPGVKATTQKSAKDRQSEYESRLSLNDLMKKGTTSDTAPVMMSRPEPAFAPTGPPPQMMYAPPMNSSDNISSMGQRPMGYANYGGPMGGPGMMGQPMMGNPYGQPTMMGGVGRSSINFNTNPNAQKSSLDGIDWRAGMH